MNLFSARSLTFTLISGVTIFIVFVLIGSWRSMYYSDVSRRDPQKMFEYFVCKAPLSSVTNIQANGIGGPFGAGFTIEFNLNSNQFEQLIREGHFEKTEASDVEYHFLGETNKFNNPAYFIKTKMESGHHGWLMMDTNHSHAIFKYSS